MDSITSLRQLHSEVKRIIGEKKSKTYCWVTCEITNYSNIVYKCYTEDTGWLEAPSIASLIESLNNKLDGKETDISIVEPVADVIEKVEPVYPWPPLTKAEAGMKVTFEGKEKGIIKALPNATSPEEVSIDGECFVVFHCDGNWENYFNYTGQLVKLSSLSDGWLEDSVTPVSEDDNFEF